MKYDLLGSSLAVSGSILSVTGALINNIWLDHTLAMWLWMFSNPILLMWAFGVSEFYIDIKLAPVYTKVAWWDGGLSIFAVGSMYAIFTISNFYGLFLGGMS